MKRTTIRVNERLLRQAKSYAAEQGKSLTSLIEEALHEKLYGGGQAPATRRRLKLPTFKGRGLQPGVDLDNTGDLTDLMDE